MKKILLILGFLPIVALASVTPEQALVEELTKLMNESNKENFTEEFYQKQLEFYNYRYAHSDKNALCYETTEALKNGLKFQHSLDYDKIKNLIVTPHINKLSNKQIKNLLAEIKKDSDDEISRDFENFINAFIETIDNQSVYNGKIYIEREVVENCPIVKFD